MTITPILLARSDLGAPHQGWLDTRMAEHIAHSQLDGHEVATQRVGAQARRVARVWGGPVVNTTPPIIAALPWVRRATMVMQLSERPCLRHVGRAPVT
jgi:hypothetical protein